MSRAWRACYAAVRLHRASPLVGSWERVPQSPPSPSCVPSTSAHARLSCSALPRPMLSCSSAVPCSRRASAWRPSPHHCPLLRASHLRPEDTPRGLQPGKGSSAPSRTPAATPTFRHMSLELRGPSASWFSSPLGQCRLSVHFWPGASSRAAACLLQRSPYLRGDAHLPAG